jgi:hypothetical protein
LWKERKIGHLLTIGTSCRSCGEHLLTSVVQILKVTYRMEQFVGIKFVGTQERGTVTSLATILALKGGGIKHGWRISRVVLHFALQMVVRFSLFALYVEES